MRIPRLQRRGSALFVTMLTVALVGFLLLRAANTVRARMDIHELSQAKQQASYAAEAAAALKESELVAIAASNNLVQLATHGNVDLGAQDLNGDGDTTDPGEDEVFAWYGDDIFFGGCRVRWRVEPVVVANENAFTVNPAPDPSTSPPPNADITGVDSHDVRNNFDYYNFRIATEAYYLSDANDENATPWDASDDADGISDRVAVAQATRVVQLRLSTLFKYALFYAAEDEEGDIEFHNGPEMNIAGSVHSNGSIYFAGDKQKYWPGDNGRVTIGSNTEQVSVVGVRGIYRTQKFPMYQAFVDGGIDSLDPLMLPLPGGDLNYLGVDTSTWTMDGDDNVNGGEKDSPYSPTNTYSINGTAMNAGVNDSRNPSEMGADWGPLVRDGRNRGASYVKTLSNIKELGGRPWEAQKLVTDSLKTPVYLFVRDPTNDDFTLTIMPNTSEQPRGYYYDPWNEDGDPTNDYNFVALDESSNLPVGQYLDSGLFNGRPASAHLVGGAFGAPPEEFGRARALYYRYSDYPENITPAMKAAPPYSGSYDESGDGNIPGLPTYIQTKPTIKGYDDDGLPIYNLVEAGGMPLFRQADKDGNKLYAPGMSEYLEDVTDPMANPYGAYYESIRDTHYAKRIYATGGTASADARMDRNGDGDESDGFRRNEALGYYAEKAIFGGHQQDPGVAVYIRERPAQITARASTAPDPSDPDFVRATGTFSASVGTTLVHWPLDDGSGTTATDFGSGNDGDVHGPAWSAGHIGSGSLGFSGADDEAVTDADAGVYLNGQDEITVAMWVQPTTSGHDRGLFTTAQPDGSDDVLALRFDDEGAEGGANDCLQATIRTTEGTYTVETQASTQWTGAWQHLTLTWRTGGGLQLFINGFPMTLSHQDETEIGGTINGIQTLILGRGTKDASSSWNGFIDDVRIYDFVVDSGDIQNAIMLGNHPNAIIPQDPYGGSAPVITETGSTTIEAELYDLGGSGVAYRDGNGTDDSTVAAFRTDGEDRDLRIGSLGAGRSVGGFGKSGDWYEYTVEFEETGYYDVEITAASAGGATFELTSGPNDVTGVITASTGDIAAFTTYSISDVGIGSGIHRLKLRFLTGTDLAIDQITFTRTADAKTFGEAAVDYLASQYQVYFGTAKGDPSMVLDITDLFFGYRAETATSEAGMLAYENWVRNRRETGFMGWRFDVDNHPTNAVALNDFKCNWLTLNMGQIMDFVRTTRYSDIDPTIPSTDTSTLSTRFNGLIYVARTRRSAHEVDPSSYHGIVEQYERNAADTMSLIPHGYHPIWNPDWQRPRDKKYFATNWDSSDYDPPAHGYDEAANATQMAAIRCGNGPDCTFQNAVRVVGGEALNWGGLYTSPTTSRVRGTTVISQNPVFLQGDFNVTMYDSSFAAMSYFALNTNGDNYITQAEVDARPLGFDLPPAAIFSDSMAVLSNDWDDNAEANFSSTLQKAAHTWYNTSVVTNNVPTYLYGVETNPSAATVVPSGGPHNLIRYLEDWGSRWYHVKGSVVVMGVARYTLAEAGWGSSSRTSNERYYSPPKRDIQFNTDLFTRPGQPPFTPFGVTVIRTVQTINLRDQ